MTKKMNEAFDELEILGLDFRFVATRYELRALRSHLDLIESNLPALQQAEVSSAWNDLRDAGLDGDEVEVEFAFWSVEDRVNRVYPRYFRSSFLLMLWGVLECGLEEVIDYRVKYSSNSPQPFDKFRCRGAKSYLEKIAAYFKEQLRTTFIKPESFDQLKLLHQVRNRLAHGNGRPTKFEYSVVFDDWKRLGIGIEVGQGGNLDFTKEFVENMYHLVHDSLEESMEQAKLDERR